MKGAVLIWFSANVIDMIDCLRRINSDLQRQTRRPGIVETRSKGNPTATGRSVRPTRS
jgi:hypothetical protein